MEKYLGLFDEYCKGTCIKVIVSGGRVLTGLLHRQPRWDKDDNSAYTITNSHSLVLFNVNEVNHIFNKKRIRKKHYD